MTKVLQELLSASDPLFPATMQQLEQSTASDGVDVRLIADITHSAHDVMRQLRLDTADCTARELYLALNAYIANESTHQLLFDASYVLRAIDGEVVSFNLIDVIENHHHQLSFEHRIVSNGQRALRGEIVARYTQHPQTSEEHTKQLAIENGLKHITDEEYPTVSDHTASATDRVGKPYILSIGDIFSDAFIQLNKDEARVETDKDGDKRLSLPFGSKPPYDDVTVVEAVGPSPNAAVSFSRLGVNSGLMAYLGDDKAGGDALNRLKHENVQTDTMSVQPGIPSNYYYVLRYGADRTILVKDEDYDYTWQEPASVPDWIYLSLLSENSWQLHLDLVEYLEQHPDTKLAFQPGTFHFKWGAQKLADVYKRSYIVVMNREEAVQVTGKSHDSLHELFDGLHELGPNIVVITDGKDGSYASHDGKRIQIPNYPDPAPPFDRTGAGDAFASTIVAALALGESMETALSWAPINSMNVVQQLGAQAGLLSRSDIQDYLEDAPDDYHAEELSE